MNTVIKTEVKKHFNSKFSKKKFVPGKTHIPVSGKVFDEKELLLGVEAVLDGWWTEGKFAKEFETEFKKFLGVRFVSLVNSGSSANLVALSALTSQSLKERSIKPGDEIITAATGFPTTVNPILLTGCIPVFVDVDLSSKNAIVSQIKKAITKKTKAIMMAHTLGNPFNLNEIIKLTEKYNLWLIEDCCDALGSRYDGRYVGTFGDVATFSFYPAHQITMGEGGAVVTDNPFIHSAVRQFRDWGRDCWCDTGKDNTCGNRFGWKKGNLPLGYDHKYIYSQIGYNLKLTDIQAAIGVAQMKKLHGFIKKRKENFQTLHDFFKLYEEFLLLPSWEEASDPCWFGYSIVVKDTAPFSRSDFVIFLEKRNIATRSLFAGNILAHPAYFGKKKKVFGSLKNADRIMNDCFWIGVYPGISKDMLSYVKKSVLEFMKKY